MRNFIWRIIYAAVFVVMFLLIVPLFLDVVGFPVGGSLWALIRICVACLAVAYVLIGPPPTTPF